MDALTYEVVDVFTDRPFAGNPLAVVFDADGLRTDQMQAIAREFRLSETVFLLPPTGSGATYRARIFTPETELPFAGHPSVGAAVTVVRAGLAEVGRVVQECGAGLLPIEVYPEGRATLTGGTPTVGSELDPAPLLAAAGLSTSDYAGPAPRLAGCGLEFPYLSVQASSVERARGGGTVSVFHWDPATRTAHTRVFVAEVGVGEDPATGSAALGFGVWLIASGLLPGDARSSYTVHQGAEIHRPSTLECTVTAVDGAAVTATVTGGVIAIARGHLIPPP